jgi:DedD protein
MVLASLVVIFLPEILDNPKDYTKLKHISSIPPISSTEQHTGLLLPPASDDEPLIPPLPSVTESFAEEPATELTAWIIKLETFTNKKKAEKLQDTLRKKGFPAFIQTQIIAKNKTNFQVQVGPELNQAQAISVATDIAKKFNLTSRVESYPSKDQPKTD